ncbi:mitotic spindle assembly checkpoint protein MAD2B isoform X3 [Rattus norvegicus]|uniref:mitotic spindle assembly checkpoint protein MAD2B isoform X3 n=1 Tax=Rattus norvegicus TaxID=10116 RepID=UPI002FD7E6D7
MCARSTRWASFRSARSTTCRFSPVGLCADVLPPRAEPVHPGHTSLRQTTPGEVQTPSCLMWSSCFEPSFLRLVCVTLSSTIILQAARLQFSCTQEKLPLGTWRRYRSSRTSPGSWQMSKMSTCMIPG